MVLAIAVTFVASHVSASPHQVHEEGAGFVGAAGCKSSSCHGGAGPKRSQFTTWSRQDFHSRAYAVLVSARSARIAETAGIAQAQTSARCTVCHAPLASIAPARRAASVQPDEGVSCENCHGAAGGWLRGHTRTDWTYRTRVGAGMHDLRNFYVRANACVACHQNVDSDLARAGHPELLFELDGQSVAEPKHWVDGDPASGPRQWLTGQAVALREMSWALARDPQASAERSRWDGLVWLLAKTLGVETMGPNPPAAATANADATQFSEMEHTADELARRAATWNFDENAILTLLRRFAAADSEFATADVSAELLARRAERLVLATERLAAAIDPALRGRLNLDPAVGLLAEDVRPLGQFDPARFVAHLQSLGAALAQAGR